MLAGFAALWGFRAARSLGVVAILLLAALVVDAVFLRWRELPELAMLRAPDRNARIAAAVGAHTLWLLNGPLSNDALIAGRRASVRFEYLSCPESGDWARHFGDARRKSPWLLLDINVPAVGGPAYDSALGPPCPAVPVDQLRHALLAAGWRPVFEEGGYQVWSAESAG